MNTAGLFSLSTLVYLLVFCSVLLLAWGLWQAWQSRHSPGAGRVARRLRAMQTASDEHSAAVSITKERLYSQHAQWQRALQRMPGVASLDRLLLQSGKNWNVARFMAWTLLCLLIGVVLASLLSLPWLMRVLLAPACAALPYWLVVRARNRRQARIEQQLPDALDLMARAMRAGHAFPTALKMVGEEMTAPLADEFRAVFDEVNFGVGMADALVGLAARVPSTDLRYFVIAVLIQRETGGNLTELLASISAIIRDRLKLMGQVRVLSAEGRMSAWVLGLMPVVMIGVMALVNPQYIRLLWTDPSGIKLLWYAAGMVALGVVWMRNVIRIRI